jgi:acyl-CoA synthetase (AMP-forming)/AMP-acid ligase II
VIFRSPYPDITIPASSVTDAVFAGFAGYPDKPALIDGPSGRTLSFRQLAETVDKVAAGLTAHGLAKGDVFAIYSPNLPEYAVAFYAVAKLGAINTTINPLYTVDELINQLNDAGAKFLLTIPQFLDKALAAAQKTAVRQVFVLGEAAAGASAFSSLLEHGATVPEVTIDPQQDLVVLPYSSGTTGLPKGVMLTHRNIVANMAQIDGITNNAIVTRDDTVIAFLPFFHIYGMVVIMNYTLAKGATIITMPRFEMEPFLRLIEQYRVTRVNLVPPVLLGLAKHPLVDQFDLSSLKTMTCGAAPLGEELARTAGRRLGCIISQGYGLTETSPVTHSCPMAQAPHKPGSVGPCIASTEALISDVDTGKSLGPNQQGEIWIRGPQVMQGYLNNPQATAACIDDNGWFHTGDIGYADDEGFFYIIDRVKELIKYKGFQVAPAELEALLVTHPAIADAAVIPSPDEEAGEIPKAFLVLKDQLETDEIMNWVAARVAPHKRIRALEFIDAIPKSLSGKILRRTLIERERAAKS